MIRVMDIRRVDKIFMTSKMIIFYVELFLKIIYGDYKVFITFKVTK